MPSLISKLLKTTGILLLMYIFVSRGWNAAVQQSMILKGRAAHESVITGEETGRAEKYNRDLAASGSDQIARFMLRMKKSPGAFDYGEADDTEYESLLNAAGDGIMGYVEIPCIGVNLPVSHYASDNSLQKGAGHLYGSSLPIGGRNTHTVITGHRGLPEAKMFTNLDRMHQGDIFILHTGQKNLYYETDRITTVLPSEFDELKIEEGRYLATLMTCTPYGVNTHRLLVRGHRVNRPESLSAEAADLSWKEKAARIFLSWKTDILAGTFTFTAGLILLYRIWRRKFKE